MDKRERERESECAQLIHSSLMLMIPWGRKKKNREKRLIRFALFPYLSVQGHAQKFHTSPVLSSWLYFVSILLYSRIIY